MSLRASRAPAEHGLTALPEPSDAKRVFVVVPCYRVAEHIAGVVAGMPAFVERIVAVNDACPFGTGDALRSIDDPRLTVVHHERNQGVGGALKTGIREAIRLGADVIVKVDGDGQMNAAEIQRLIEPLLAERAAYTKGNRFWYIKELEQMPFARRLGNLALSFWVKAASGHWGVFDPTNGFVASRADVLASLDLDRIANDYFFEISLLIELGRRGYRVLDIPMPSRYADEKSSLSIKRVLLSFPPRLLRLGLNRFIYRHFWFGFSISALFLLAGIPLTLWGVGFGLWAWWRSYFGHEMATAGTVMLAALPFLTGFQLLLQALNYEVRSHFNNRVSPDAAVVE